MSYSDAAISLLRPELEDLPRIGDRISFLFLDRARIEQGRTGLEAWLSIDEQPYRIAVPTASLAVLCLGPGTSISNPALATLFRSGTSVVFTGADGLVGYSTVRPLATDGSWAMAQARVWADPKLRLQAARTLYQQRFPDNPLPEDLPLKTLRGLEGQRVKQTYRQFASQHKVKDFRRVTLGAEDAVNICLNRANSILYGVALAVTGALGLSTSLGFIHQGATGAFLYDLADVYKTTVTIPAAFKAGSMSDPHSNIGRLVRERIHSQKVLIRMIELVKTLLEPYLRDDDREDRLLDDQGFVPGHKNWHLE